MSAVLACFFAGEAAIARIKLEKGRSIYDVPNRLVVDAIMSSPWKHSGWAGWFTNDWQIAPIFQWQNGLPLNVTTRGTPSITAPDKALGSGITAQAEPIAWTSSAATHSGSRIPGIRICVFRSRSR
jgi:hypothetical protein